MRKVLFFITALSGLVVGGGLWWRREARRQASFPSWLGWYLNLPIADFPVRRATILDRADLRPGMRVLDVGAGPGRLSIPATGRVEPEGEVVALDMQPGMLQLLEQRAAEQGVTNVRAQLGAIGDGALQQDGFDRALLVAVLGEVHQCDAAMREIYAALKPDGVLSVTEAAFPDPHFVRQEALQQLAEHVGFRLADQSGGRLAYTMNFVKPTTEGASESDEQ